MLDVDEKTNKLFISCDVPVGEDFCTARIDFLDETYDDHTVNMPCDLVETEDGTRLNGEHVQAILAEIQIHKAQFRRCHQAALTAGWGEHIYPGEASATVDGKKTFGVNDLCPAHLDWKPEQEDVK